ncbi:hypothetical protein N7540_010064 [Penicillium herquei]|nr:hypothetical protein N7540_010064 [Penicillium herquei]
MPQYPSEQFRPGQPTPEARPQRRAPSSLKGHPDIRSTKEYKLAARSVVAMAIKQAMLWPAFRRCVCEVD